MASRVLLIGIGNPARGDDGLGPALAERVAGEGLPGVDVDATYQLAVEDAVEVARHDVVIFADADCSCDPPFRLTRVHPAATDASFSTHSVSPAAVMALAERHFGSRCEGWLLGVRGYSFEPFAERLSEGAVANLGAAMDAIHAMIRTNSFGGGET